METNIKRNITKDVAGDGAITLKFKQMPTSPLVAPGAAIGIMVVACIPAGIVASLVQSVVGTSGGSLFFVTWLLCIFGIIKLLRKPGVILIKPGAGIVVGARNLAFKDISRLTVKHSEAAFIGKSSGQVRAEVHGSSVAVTQWVKSALANALIVEIEASRSPQSSSR